MITLKRVKQLLRPDFETGQLFWVFNHQRPDLIGQQAGYLNHGYWWVTIDGQSYYVCQILWLFAYEVFPDRTVDHRDNTSTNDRLSNLRLATKGQNAANSKVRTDNSSGYKGVSFCSSTGKWRASIQINGCSKNLGRYVDVEEAHQVWLVAAQKAFGEEYVRAS